MFNLKPNIILKDFQVEGFRYLLTHNYAIVADQMGLGKTLEAIAVASFLRNKTLVICPSYLRRNWASEIDKFSMRDNVRVIESGADLDSFEPYDEHFIVMSYSLLNKADKLFAWCDMLIADENHYCKSPEAKRTNYFFDLLKKYRPSRFLSLTGTPLKGKVEELYTQLCFMEQSPTKLGVGVSEICKNYWSFRKTFTNARTEMMRGRTITKFSGVKNLNVLKKLLRGKYIRRDSSVLKLPPYVEKDVMVDYVDPKEKELWEAFLGKDKSSDSRTKAAAALRKANFTIKYAKDLMESEDSSIVIYSDHVDSCRRIASKLGVPYIDGSVSMKERERIVDSYKKGEIKYFVATIGAASTGITLTVGNHLIFNDINWTEADNSQALHRIYRIGQEKTAIVHYITGSNTDLRIRKTLREKIRVSKAVL